jgi:hypothetical protein
VGDGRQVAAQLLVLARPEGGLELLFGRAADEIVHGQRRISADTALRLARYFGTSERFWINLQARYDLEVEKDRLAGAAHG